MEREDEKPDLPQDGLRVTLSARSETIQGEPQLKVGYFGEHVVYCDEPDSLGGQDEYPPPLGYIGLAVGY